MRLYRSLPAMAVALSLMLLAACGKNSPSNEAKAPSSDASAAPVKLTVLAAPVGFQPLFIGKSEGIFAKHGIDLDISQDLVTAAEAVPQALSGKFQVITTSLMPLAQAVGSGIPIKAVASGMNDEPGKPSIGGLLVPKGSSIKTVADLGGKTVAINGLGTSLHVAVMQRASSAGVDPKTIKFVNIPYNGMVQAALNGNVDGVYVLESFRQQALDKGFVQVSEPLKEAFPNSSWIIYAMTDSFIRENPKVVASFVAALKEASELANEHTDRVRAVDRERTKLPAAYIDTRTISAFSTFIDIDAIRHQFEAARKFGIVDSLPEIDKFIATDLIARK